LKDVETEILVLEYLFAIKKTRSNDIERKCKQQLFKLKGATKVKSKLLNLFNWKIAV